MIAVKSKKTLKVQLNKKLLILLIKEKKLRRKDIPHLLGMSSSRFNRILSGAYQMKIGEAIAMSNLFEIPERCFFLTKPFTDMTPDQALVFGRKINYLHPINSEFIKYLCDELNIHHETGNLLIKKIEDHHNIKSRSERSVQLPLI